MSQLTTSQRAEIINLYAHGTPVLKIADKFGISETCVRDATRGVDRHIYCRLCGLPIYIPYGRHMQFYCDSCRQLTRKPEKKRGEEKPQTLDDTVRAANAAGMSYGQYVLMRDYLHKEV